MLRALANKGGVIQICILDAYVKAAPPNPARDQALQELRNTYGESEKLPEDKKREMFEKWEEINRQFPQSNANVSDVSTTSIMSLRRSALIVDIGTDFDGGGGVTDCRDVSQMGNIANSSRAATRNRSARSGRNFCGVSRGGTIARERQASAGQTDPSRSGSPGWDAAQ
jgi:microsomal dipeptidase-like Zn-dependent dipeptidase